MSSIMAIGSGLVSGRAGHYNDFTVYTHKPGIGGLAVGIDGPSRAEIRYTDNNDGTVKVSYFPKAPGEYHINLKYDGLHVRGSPYKVRVRGEEPSYSSSTKNFFDDPFSAKSYFDEPVFQERSNAAGRVRVYGRGLYSGITNVQNEIEINVKDAGNGRLHWSIEGPGHVETRNRSAENGIYKLYYKPDKPGDYHMKIKYDDREVYGSPFKIRVL